MDMCFHIKHINNVHRPLHNNTGKNKQQYRDSTMAKQVKLPVILAFHMDTSSCPNYNSHSVGQKCLGNQWKMAQVLGLYAQMI